MYLGPLSFLDFGELVVVEVVVGVHVHNLTLGGGPQHLDNLDEMVDTILSNEKGSPLNHLEQDTAHRPDIYHGGVVSGSEDELGRPVASRADVGQIGLVSEDFC